MNVHVPTPTNAATVKPIEVARQAFWSLRHPLNQAMIAACGNSFSLKQLIAFAEDVPPEILAAYATEGGEVIAAEIEG